MTAPSPPADNALPATVDHKHLYRVFIIDPRSGQEIHAYTGRTLDLQYRAEAGASAHMSKNWGWLVTRFEVETLPVGATDDDLALAERLAIEAEATPLNIEYNRDPETGQLRTDWGLCQAIADAEEAEATGQPLGVGWRVGLWTRAKLRRSIRESVEAARFLAGLFTLALTVGLGLAATVDRFAWVDYIPWSAAGIVAVVYMIALRSWVRIRRRSRRLRRQRRRKAR